MTILQQTKFASQKNPRLESNGSRRYPLRIQRNHLSNHFRRTDPRYDRRLEVQVLSEGKTVIATSQNISLGGMLVEATEALPERTPVLVRFSVSTQAESIEVTGEIRWAATAQGGSVEMGIRFNGLRAREVWALNRLFQS
ncbi:MAG: PilZ domain-containing protein [Deltaproteobacteria bacterium]|nr:PilZ domain-containing protein [Deltaproteobacteria bacterium]